MHLLSEFTEKSLPINNQNGLSKIQRHSNGQMSNLLEYNRPHKQAYNSNTECNDTQGNDYIAPLVGDQLYP